jgi:uncharacterized membrane protein YciS (DUF1049 family)
MAAEIDYRTSEVFGIVLAVWFGFLLIAAAIYGLWYRKYRALRNASAVEQAKRNQRSSAETLSVIDDVVSDCSLK